MSAEDPAVQEMQQWARLLRNEINLLERTRAQLKYCRTWERVMGNRPRYGVFYAYLGEHDDPNLPPVNEFAMPFVLITPQSKKPKETPPPEVLDTDLAELRAEAAMLERAVADAELYKPGGIGHWRLVRKYRGRGMRRHFSSRNRERTGR